MRLHLPLVASIAAALLFAGPVLAAKKLYTAANGIDSASCGAQTKPCRSISKAIDLASDGDTITVGPGVYSIATGETGARLGTVVAINKAVHVVSTAGAERTIITGPGPTEAQQQNIVDVTADGAQFGAKDEGFTVIHRECFCSFTGDTDDMNDTYGDTIGVYVAAVRTVISGNVAVGNTRGFSIEPIEGSGQVLMQYNSASGGLLGFFLSGRGGQISVLVSYNSASDNVNGFSLDGGTVQIVTHNTATRNKLGFSISGGTQVLHNTIEGNRLGGIGIDCPSGLVPYAPVDVSQNAIVANGGPGIQVSQLCAPVAKFHQNNIFANAATIPTGPPAPQDNCGLLNNDPDSPPVDASDNYWGAASGPGADPADQVCGSPSTIKPVSTGRFSID